MRLPWAVSSRGSNRLPSRSCVLCTSCLVRVYFGDRFAVHMHESVEGRAAYKRVAPDDSAIEDSNPCARPRLCLEPLAYDESFALLEEGAGVELVGLGTGADSGPDSGKTSSHKKAGTAQEEIDVIFRDQVERLLRSPKQLVTALLELQSTKLNPLDVESSPAVADIAQHVADAQTEAASLQLRGAADPLASTSYKYDCFISYRVASEASTAETLFLYLDRRGLRPFLDKKCLTKGANWKEDFLDSLRQSRTFVPLVSNKALEKCRDAHLDHSKDNFLLEIQTALSIKRVRDKHGITKFILPVLVCEAQHDSTIASYDFSVSYSDSVSPRPQSYFQDLMSRYSRLSCIERWAVASSATCCSSFVLLIIVSIAVADSVETQDQEGQKNLKVSVLSIFGGMVLLVFLCALPVCSTSFVCVFCYHLYQSFT